MEAKKSLVISYLVQSVIAIAIAVGVAWGQGFTTDLELVWWCRLFSDGFFVSALLFIGIGLLIWVSTTGFFDIFSYGFSSLLVLFTPLKKPSDHKHYYEYKCEKEAKRKGKGSPLSILFVGIACLLLSTLLVFLYYQLGGV
ncbi:MAG: DUF3899 domain-containing protein [Clostridia bacterium]|nr:DUF3899 domain-containing protein [Clostridia bacterium]